ncbi:MULTISPECIES: DUF1801 domain-containing protein [Rossellomorea]|uniref:DUF1801 domain-containing protein n=1 Tax=Rossellomorea TaxID=2837508 RepID=UPI00064EC6D4|nr:DUF1801 domain-containing protein [Rossellomorea marisflavi]KMK97224.1 hypothetical protein VL03_00465 [Rossellomorea marisflavi]TYO72562.1 DUF1801 domain-containing protein [Rossellomorea marisflavi]USK90237.1 DUF1801 domain-containing protein [Rossellomorea marisflavi]
MYELKTKETDADVLEYIETSVTDNRREDAFKLLDLFTEASGFAAKMWGKSIIGFGSYHYKYASGHEGDAALAGFSPRKSKISIYLGCTGTEKDRLLSNLGKHTSGKGCVYINRLSDADADILKELIRLSIHELQTKYPANG